MDLGNEADGEGAERILGLIKRRGPQRVSDVSAALGITNEAARQQLARLAQLALVVATSERHGVGRPAREWQLTAAGHARFPDRHAELTLSLLDAVRDEFGSVAIDRMIGRREAEMRHTYARALEGVAGTASRVDALAAMRTREGYMAEVAIDGDAWILIENHCPICAAATACQGFCRSELDVFRNVLGERVTVERTDHLLAGARRCAYRINDVKENRDDLDRRHVARRARGKAKARRPA
jgi:predicted ArsR family transcriptional regulator